MAVSRIFVGWDKPLCETVPAYLLRGTEASSLFDLRGTVVVVPTRQSSWRLRAALPLAATACDKVLLGLEIVTPPVLLEPENTVPRGTSLDGLLAWIAVFTDIKPGEYTAFLGTHEGRPSHVAWALQVARQLQALRRELADGGLTIATAAENEALLEEQPRWLDMAELEQRYLTQLEDWGLCDGLMAKIDAAHKGALPPEIERVIIAAVPDPPQLLLSGLDRWAANGGSVEVIVAAPESEADAFDAWGRPLPQQWQQRRIPLRDDDLWLEATPEDQAARLARVIGESMASHPVSSAALRPEIAIGAPDREAVVPLQRALATLGLPAFDPQNRPLAETALFRLIHLLLALRDTDGYAEVAALLRHPDVMATCDSCAEMLRQLDHFQSERLPVTLAGMPETATPHVGQELVAALERVRQWRAALQHDTLASGLRHVLQQIYQTRSLHADHPADLAFQQAVAAFDMALREYEDAAGANRPGAEDSRVFLARLREGTVKAERRNEPLDIEGWLELAWNPAPLLFVLGMNTGLVPDGRMADPFLPDARRHALGLRDDRLRLARDAYVLTALLEQRRTNGKVILLVGKTSSAGDPLRPSRLLFRCADEALIPRAQKLLQDPPPAQTAQAFSLSFKLDPARVPPQYIDDKRTRTMSPTLFRTYLECPLRFYLRHVLKMEPLDDLTREPDARTFGNWMHDVLEAMAQDSGQIWACGDADKLALWLKKRLTTHVRSLHGLHPWLGVDLALESAAHRLEAFAVQQVQWHEQGWEITAQETKHACTLGGLTVQGRIDRMDRHRETGQICLLDYKTTDKANSPEKTHIGPMREDDDLAAAVIPAALGDKKKERRWRDLQLPLYREFVRAEFGPEVALGYICLPVALGEGGFSLWQDYSPALHASALDCATAISQRIRNGVFWPPGKRQASYTDDLAGVLLDDPLKTLEQPLVPWRRNSP